MLFTAYVNITWLQAQICAEIMPLQCLKFVDTKILTYNKDKLKIYFCTLEGHRAHFCSLDRGMIILKLWIINVQLTTITWVFLVELEYCCLVPACAFLSNALKLCNDLPYIICHFGVFNASYFNYKAHTNIILIETLLLFVLSP